MGESQRVRKNNRKKNKKKRVKARKKKIPSEMCWVDALFGGPGKSRFKTWEANCRWVWRENAQISKKKRSERKKSKKKSSRPKNVG